MGHSDLGLRNARSSLNHESLTAGRREVNNELREKSAP